MNAPLTQPEISQTKDTDEQQAVRVEAHYESVRRLGHWTTTRHITARARRGHVVLDLRSPRIEDGDIEIELNLDRSALKLLVPDDVVIDHWDLETEGRVRIKDRYRHGPTNGRRIHLTGRLRRGEVRVHRGGMATLSAMLTKEFAVDAYRAHKEGGHSTVDDPARNP